MYTKCAMIQKESKEINTSGSRLPAGNTVAGTKFLFVPALLTKTSNVIISNDTQETDATVTMSENLFVSDILNLSQSSFKKKNWVLDRHSNFSKMVSWKYRDPDTFVSRLTDHLLISSFSLHQFCD